MTQCRPLEKGGITIALTIETRKNSALTYGGAVAFAVRFLKFKNEPKTYFLE